MFKKRSDNHQENASAQQGSSTLNKTPAEAGRAPVQEKTKNRILRGNRLIGNINITTDLDLSGDIEGDIASDQDSDIMVRGTCRGNIHTKGGSVDIEGELRDGNITAGSDVRITGKFNGGEIRAQGCIRINGSFNGRLEGSEIELGPASSGTGEILYKDHILIEKGAQVEGQISKMPAELTLVTDAPGKTEAAPAKEVKEASQ